VDATSEHWIAKAEAASLEAEAAEDAAEAVLAEAREIRRASEKAWLIVLESAQRREAPWLTAAWSSAP
jgi:hypothetical protein